MNKRQIGQFVKEQRESAGLSQKALADKAQVRRQTVIDIENASLGYAIDKLLLVLDALEIKILMIPVALFRFRKTKK